MPHESVTTQVSPLSRRFAALSAAAVCLSGVTAAEMASQTVEGVCNRYAVTAAEALPCDTNARVRGLLPGILDIAVPDFNPRPLFEQKGLS